MSDQFLAEIRLFPFNFAPFGWQLCQGQLLAISQNTALFSLIGTMYGGNGTSNFALPDLRGMVPLQQGQGPGLSLYAQGETSGTASVTLVTNQLPTHTHNFTVSSADTNTVTAGAGNQLAQGLTGNKQNSFAALIYSPNAAQATTQLPSNAVSFTGGNLPHNNLMPYLTLNYCIALQGIFPSRP